MMFTICVTYAVVSPIILIWGCAYFSVAWFTYTYQLIYVFKRSNDTGGASFPAIYGRLNNGMIIGQLVIIAMFVLLKAMIPAVIFVFVPIYTISTKSSAKSFGYYFKKTCVNTANEEGFGKVNIVTKGENNFIAPAVKALLVRRWCKEGSEEQKEKGHQQLDDVARRDSRRSSFNVESINNATFSDSSAKQRGKTDIKKEEVKQADDVSRGDTKKTEEPLTTSL